MILQVAPQKMHDHIRNKYFSKNPEVFVWSQQVFLSTRLVCYNRDVYRRRHHEVDQRI